MISFLEWRLVENLQFAWMGGEGLDFPEEEFGIEYDEAVKQAYALVKASGINILRDKELKEVVLSDGKVVGALFDSWDQGEGIDEYSFDVIVHPSMQQQGLGKKLIDSAIHTFRSEDRGGETRIKAEVVNKFLIPVLQRYGFKALTPQEAGGVIPAGVTIMVYPPPA